MIRFLSLYVVLLPFLVQAVPNVWAADGGGKANKLAPRDWPWWRGPTRNGIAPADERPPLSWSETSNVLWKTPLRGRGHGSPIVVGNHVLLATADHEANEQVVICLERRTGKKVWQRVVHRDGLATKGNKKASQASSSLACSGDRLFINFLHDGAVYTTALSRGGEQQWQTKITDYVVHQGYGSSPAIYRDLVIVSADNKGGGAIAGLEQATGKIVWKVTRPKTPNYASPIILPVAGKDQALFIGCNRVTSLAPLTGKTNWEIRGATTECVTSTVTDGTVVFSSGGYPRNHVAAIRADGSGKIAWENKTRVYVPSMLVHQGYLYAVADAGFAICWRTSDGKQMWKNRIEGTFTSSPLLVNGHILATNERGRTYVFKADPTAFQLVGTNQLGDQMYASAVASRNQLFLRVAKGRGRTRREWLYCVGRPD